MTRPRAVYVISVVAEMTGLHPQTLRNYERAHLLAPTRTRGQQRRFSETDLVRLRRIIELTAAGVNLAGVRLILELEAQLVDARAEIAHTPSTALAVRR